MPNWSCSNRQHRRLLISQDRHEIFLTMALFNDKYVQYVKNHLADVITPDPDEDEFMVMQTYGPFDVTQKDHMGPLAASILGFVREMDE